MKVKVMLGVIFITFAQGHQFRPAFINFTLNDRIILGSQSFKTALGGQVVIDGYFFIHGIEAILFAVKYLHQREYPGQHRQTAQTDAVFGCA